MKRKKYIWWTGFSCAFLLLVVLLREHVLLHIPDSSCACGDDPITGFIVLNPMRDRSPENSAEVFLKDLRSGKCSADCTGALNNHRISNWQLKNRDDRWGSVELYYRVIDHDTESGMGVVDLVRRKDSWVVTSYSAVF